MRGKRMAALVQKRKRRRKSRKAEKPARSWRSDRRTHQSRRPSLRSSEKGGGWKGGGEGGGSRGGDPKARTASREEDDLGGGRESATRTEEEQASSGKAGPEAVTACTSLKSVSAIRGALATFRDTSSSAGGISDEGGASDTQTALLGPGLGALPRASLLGRRLRKLLTGPPVPRERRSRSVKSSSAGRGMDGMTKGELCRDGDAPDACVLTSLAAVAART